MTRLLDQAPRERFATELDHSFSVIAPAGVGKTFAIVERVANLLRQDGPPIALVTYTQKAANEMREKLERKIGRAANDPTRLFSGTIHSFCTRLIRENPAKFGVGAAIEVVPADYRLWCEFIESEPAPFSGEAAQNFYRYVGMNFSGRNDWLEFIYAAPVPENRAFVPPPEIDLAALEAEEIPSRCEASFERLLDWARWQNAQREGGLWVHCDYERPDSKGMQDLLGRYYDPYQNWYRREAAEMVAQLAAKFRAWRIRHGKLTYDDLISVAAEGAEGLARYAVVLDEAQDTSLLQLQVLQKVAARDAGFFNFSMVGDPQQLIYSSRVSLSDYLATHRSLMEHEGLTELTFTETFRCPKRVVDFVNQTAPVFLNGANGQAKFVPLTPVDETRLGQLEKITLTFDGQISTHDSENTRRAAKALVERLRAFDLAHLHRVAILSPRKNWLQPIISTCREAGIACQLFSEGESRTPARAYLRSLLWLMSHPADGFELLGLLREITALPDAQLAQAYHDFPDAFSLARGDDHARNGQVDAVLSKLKGAWREAGTLAPQRALISFASACGVREALEGISWAAVAEWDELLTGLLPKLVLPMSDNIAALEDALKEKPVARGHLQLLTMHKAKGLEWDVVILPFMGRAIPPKPGYPRWESSGAAFSKSDLEDRDRGEETRELGRLLYVALTRARNQLILVDDFAFFKKSKEGYKGIFGLFQAPPEAVFPKIPEAKALSVGDEKTRVEILARPTGVEVPRELEVVVPSALVVHDGELTEEQRLGEGGARYGNWWHDLWPQVGFKKDLPTLLTYAQSSPLPQRAEREIKAFFGQELYGRLARASCRFECPLLARAGERVIEGRLDLLAELPDGGLLVVDWKTDQLPIEKIREAYAAQLEAYRDGVAAYTHRPTHASLYSTFHAQWIVL